MKLEDVANYNEIRQEIVSQLTVLRDTPNCTETPLIYHLDVAAMYPNIILTNRLQPDAIVDSTFCATCDFNEGPDSTCQRSMTWSWRGEIFSAKKGEYSMLINQLETERFVSTSTRFGTSELPIPYHELEISQKNAIIKKRVTEYSKKVYKKAHDTQVIERESTVWYN